MPSGEWFCPSCKKEMCAVCKKHGLGIHDNIVCGNEDGTKGCERIFHLVGERGGTSCVEVRGVDGSS